MPAPHDLDPPSFTEEERLAKRRYQAYHAFEQMPSPYLSQRQFGIETVWDDRGIDEGDAGDVGDTGGEY